jgi:mannose/fructose/N-acetylgalactosamine-specific phosphotransferase system component IIC
MLAWLPINCFDIWGKINFVFSILSGFVMYACMFILSDPYRDPDINDICIPVATSTYAFSVMTAIIAYPLTFKGAQKYLKQRNSTGKKCLMKTAWILYGIYLVYVLAILAVVASLRFAVLAVPGILASLLNCAGWGCMLFYQENARKLPVANEEHQRARISKMSKKNVI